MKVRLFATLRQLVGMGEIEMALHDGDTVGSVLARLVVAHPVLGERVFDEDGNLETSINVFINRRSIRFLDSLNTCLNEDDELAIFPPVAGG